MKPENVNPKNFSVEKVIYEDEDFSIAYGTWMEETEGRLAMRWNGDTIKDAGYPKTFGNPMWFQVTEELTDLFLTSLLSSSNAKKAEILKILTKRN